MRVHHLNCISTCPLGGALMDGQTESILRRGRLSCHCLLVETDRDGLVLIDTGLGLRDVADPSGRLSRFFLFLLAPEWRAEMTARRQLEALGFDPRDVRHIVLSHLDFDHAGGVDDFPDATVHLLAAERARAFAQRSLLDRMRYRPRQWSTRDRWQVYPSGGGEPWYGFEAVRALDGVPPEIVLVPLLGHTMGHTGVAVRTGGGWFLYASDAYFFRGEMDPVRPHCTPGLRLYQWMMEQDRAQRLANQERLRVLGRSTDEVEIFCAHDIVEYERLSGRSAVLPASAVLRRVPEVTEIRPPGVPVTFPTLGR